MLMSAYIHIGRVHLTGGHQEPRELTWPMDVTAAPCTHSFGLTGYNSPRDQVGYQACRIVTAAPEAMDEVVTGPAVIGHALLLTLRYKSSVGQSTLTRFFSTHVSALPVAIATVVLVHFQSIRKQGILGSL